MLGVVFSSTLAEASWQNAKVVRGDAVAAVERMKGESGGDLVTYGYTRLADALFRRGLVDVLRVSIHPVVVGRGRRWFGDGFAAKMNLLASTTYAKGVVLVTYGTA